MDSISIASYGEDRLVAALLAELPKPGHSVLTAAGDDCAVVCFAGARRRQLLKTDCVIEGVHFLPDTPPEQIGWKALCRPLSDIAAMGGKPKHALVTLALHPDTDLARAQGIYAGIGIAAREFDVDVVGGETARSPGPCFLSVSVTGIAPKRAAVRSGGAAGDLLFVTGRLGGSFTSGRHLTFRPRLKEGRWLVRHFPVHAMMDLSDGLAADLPRLARASHTGFSLDEAALPCSQGCTPAQALGDGEDYELLFALAPKPARELATRWVARFPETPVTCIGRLTPRNANQPMPPGGFDHFAHPAALPDRAVHPVGEE